MGFFTWLISAQTKCTGTSASVYPVITGCTGAGPSVKPVQLTLLSLLFHYDLSSQRWIRHISTVNWTSWRWFGHHPWNLKNYEYDLTNLLVSLIMLSHNHQNQKQWPNGVMFLTIAKPAMYSCQYITSVEQTPGTLIDFKLSRLDLRSWSTQAAAYGSASPGTLSC